MPNPYSGPSYKKRRIGLLGGSFNPAHEGHLAMSVYALKRLGLDEVWWLVSPQNPLKTTHDMAPFQVRLGSAAQLARHPAIKVLDIEGRLGTRFTVDTLKALRRRFPATHFVWLMGADNLGQVPRWKNWTAIFKIVPVAVFRRPAYAAGRKFGKASIRFDRGWRSAAKGKKLGGMKTPAWLVLDNPLNPLSATRLRAQRKGKRRGSSEEKNR